MAFVNCTEMSLEEFQEYVNSQNVIVQQLDPVMVENIIPDEPILAIEAPPPAEPQPQPQPTGLKWGRFRVAAILGHKKRGKHMTFRVTFQDIRGEFLLKHGELALEHPGPLGEYLAKLSRSSKRSWTQMVRNFPELGLLVPN